MTNTNTIYGRNSNTGEFLERKSTYGKVDSYKSSKKIATEANIADRGKYLSSNSGKLLSTSSSRSRDDLADLNNRLKKISR